MEVTDLDKPNVGQFEMDEGLDPERELLEGNDIENGDEVYNGEHEDREYSSDDSMINELKGQLEELQKEMTEQKEIMNSLMMIPKKTEYLIYEVKKELTQTLQDSKKESLSEIKELRDYIHTLHTEVSSGVSSIKKMKEQKPSNQMMADLSLELTAIKKSIEDLKKDARKSSSLLGRGLAYTGMD